MVRPFLYLSVLFIEREGFWVAQALERDLDIDLFDAVDELRWKGPTPAFQSLATRLDAALSA